MNEVLNIFEEQLRQIGNSRIGEFLDDSSQFETLGLLIIVPLILITFIAFYLRFRRENPPHPGRKGKYRRTGFRRIWLGNIHAEFVGALITGILFLIIGSVQAGFEAKEHRDDLIEQMNSPNNTLAVLAVEELRAEGWLQDGSLAGRIFDRANLQGADLHGANLRCTVFARNVLVARSLTLEDANLSNTDLRGAYLERVSLRDTNLTGANLVGIEFGAMDFRDLNSVDFTRTRVVLDEATWLADVINPTTVGLDAAPEDETHPHCGSLVKESGGDLDRRDTILAGIPDHQRPGTVLTNIRLSDMLSLSTVTQTIGLAILIPLTLLTFIYFALDVLGGKDTAQEKPSESEAAARRQGPESVGVGISWFSDIHAEFVGAFLTGVLFLGVGLLGAGVETQQRQSLLFSQMGSNNAIASSIAFEELRAEGWLEDDTLTGREFSDANFSNVDLSDVNFSNASFTDVDFSGSILRNVNFTDAVFTNVNFDTAILSEATLTGATLTDVTMRNGFLRKIDFGNVIMSNVSFIGSDLTNSCFANAALQNVNLSQATTGSPDFAGATADAFTLARFGTEYLLDGSICMSEHGYESIDGVAGNIPPADVLQSADSLASVAPQIPFTPAAERLRQVYGSYNAELGVYNNTPMGYTLFYPLDWQTFLLQEEGASLWRAFEDGTIIQVLTLNEAESVDAASMALAYNFTTYEESTQNINGREYAIITGEIGNQFDTAAPSTIAEGEATLIYSDIDNTTYHIYVASEGNASGTYQGMVRDGLFIGLDSSELAQQAAPQTSDVQPTEVASSDDSGSELEVATDDTAALPGEDAQELIDTVETDDAALGLEYHVSEASSYEIVYPSGWATSYEVYPDGTAWVAEDVASLLAVVTFDDYTIADASLEFEGLAVFDDSPTDSSETINGRAFTVRQGTLEGTSLAVMYTLVDGTAYFIYVGSEDPAFFDELYAIVTETFTIDASIGEDVVIEEEEDSPESEAEPQTSNSLPAEMQALNASVDSAFTLGYFSSAEFSYGLLYPLVLPASYESFDGGTQLILEDGADAIYVTTFEILSEDDARQVFDASFTFDMMTDSAVTINGREFNLRQGTSGDTFAALLGTLADDTFYLIYVASNDGFVFSELYNIVTASFTIDDSVGASSALAAAPEPPAESEASEEPELEESTIAETEPPASDLPANVQARVDRINSDLILDYYIDEAFGYEILYPAQWQTSATPYDNASDWSARDAANGITVIVRGGYQAEDARSSVEEAGFADFTDSIETFNGRDFNVRRGLLNGQFAARIATVVADRMYLIWIDHEDDVTFNELNRIFAEGFIIDESLGESSVFGREESTEVESEDTSGDDAASAEQALIERVDSTIDLVYFADEAFGVEMLVPAGWEQALDDNEDGTFFEFTDEMNVIVIGRVEFSSENDPPVTLGSRDELLEDSVETINGRDFTVLQVATDEQYGVILATLIDDTLYVVVVASDEQAFSDELYHVVSQSFSIDESLGASSAIDIDDLIGFESSSSALDLVFEESFDDNARDWEVYTDGTIFSDFVDGSYQIQLTNFSSRWYVLPGFENWSLAPTFTEPYELEFEISDVQSSTGHYELLILFDGQEGYDGTKALHITSSGTYYRGVVATGTQTGTQARPFDPSFDLLDGQTHQIRLQVWEDRYVVFIDDTQLFEQPSIGPISGSVGFGFGVLGSETATLSARFDNLIVRRL